MRRIAKLILTTAALSTFITAFYACNKPDSTPSGDSVNSNGFDKTAMLKDYADGLIIPAYTALQQQLSALQTASEAFIQAPAPGSQAALKTAYTEAQLQYERVAAFQFGPAETALLDPYLNFSGGLDYSFTTAGDLTGFSVDTATIETNIATGSYDLTSMQRSSFYSQGFAALSYLYFAPNAIARMSPARAAYIRDVLGRMKALVDKVATDWTAYRGEFIANTKTNVGSPIGNIVNQLAYQMDLLKGPRIGWPLGKQSNGIVFATKTEAYYAGISVALAVENLAAAKNLYTAGNGKGISAYLVSLSQAELNRDVLAQFDIALAKLRAIPDPLSASLTADAADVDAAYKEIQKLLTLLKTDVASATAVQITFMDNDGD
jgi:predicted lipoprotein